MVFYRDLEANQFVIPGSGHHMRMPPDVRLGAMFDDGEFEEITLPEVSQDPLRFRDERRYADRLKEARTRPSAMTAFWRRSAASTASRR